MAFNIVKLIADELARIKPGLPIYRENQRGGFQEPSFFVEKLPAQVVPNLFGIQQRSSHFQLIYFPNENRPNEDMDEMEEFLTDNFGRLGNFAYIRDREFSHSDDTLILSFRVTIRAVPVDQTIKQQVMNYEGGLKRGGE